MSEYVWSRERDRAIELYGDTPGASLEERIISVFERKPALVSSAIDHVADRFKRGLIHTPWVILMKHVEESDALRDVTVTDSSEREAKIARAEKWIRAAGVHYDRENEVIDELFGDHGMLRTWKSDEMLRARLAALWREQRPRGEQTETEAEARAAAYVEMRKRLREKTTK